jgi:trans-aconitate 2-methyltransferase
MAVREDSAGRCWDVALYENKHSFVWKSAADLIELLSPKKGERILDLGCGTGHLTHKIAAREAEVIGIDNSALMLAKARGNYPKLQFEQEDGARFHFAEPFDAVFSNAALHWIREAQDVIACVWKSLKPRGRFVAEFGGKGNVQTIILAVRGAVEAAGCSGIQEIEPWYFPTIGEYSTLLEKQGFSVTYAALFDRPTPLEGGDKGMRDWIQMFDNLLTGVPMDHRDPVIKDIEARLRPKLCRDGTWLADYKRIRVVAVKE